MLFRSGTNGAAGAKGETGAQGIQGIQGLKGDTGATGATGPAGPAGSVNVKVITLTSSSNSSWTFSAAGPTSSPSDAFGNLGANKSFKFNVILTLQTSKSITWNNYALGAYVSTDQSGTNPTYSTQYGTGKYIDSGGVAKYQASFIITGVVTTSAVTNLIVTLYDNDGLAASAFGASMPVSVSGKALVEEVGSIV